MKKNIAKQKIKKGIPSIGTWVSSGNPLVCETLATSGIDWINIECEHSSIDLGELVHCFRAVEHSDIPVFVRVAGSDPLIIKNKDWGLLESQSKKLVEIIKKIK
mgnify:CR=1 FL=1